MAPTIHIVRHAQGHHNVGHRWHLRDPDLTARGIAQCEQLAAETSELQGRVTSIVSSPSWRCIRTAVLGLPEVVLRPGQEVLLHPALQEVADSPCNVPQDADALDDLGGEYVNTALLTPGYNDRGPGSPYRAVPDLVVERARAFRVWLRGMARTAGPDAEIFVVTHGGLAPFLIGGVARQWHHAQPRAYQFVDLSGSDPQAALVPVDEDSEEDSNEDMDGADDNGDGDGGGSSDPPRGILKRRHDDDDDSPSEGADKKRKKVSWAPQLERIRVFRSSLDAAERSGLAVYPPTRDHPLSKLIYPALFVRFDQDLSELVQLHARQIQRFTDSHPEGHTFSVVEYAQARAMQPLDAAEETQAGEDSWPATWDLSHPQRDRYIDYFQWEWQGLFPDVPWNIVSQVCPRYL